MNSSKHPTYTAHGQVTWGRAKGSTESGNNALGRIISEKYLFCDKLSSKISGVLDNHPDWSKIVEETVSMVAEYVPDREKSYEIINSYFSREMCPMASEIQEKVSLFERNGENNKEKILRQIEIFRSEVKPEVLKTIIALFISATGEIEAKEIGDTFRKGVTLNVDALNQKIGFCISNGLTADCILERPIILSDMVSIDLLNSTLELSEESNELEFIDLDRVLDIISVCQITAQQKYILAPSEKINAGLACRSFVKKHCK